MAKQRPARARSKRNKDGSVGSAVAWGSLNTIFVRLTNIVVMAIIARFVTEQELGSYSVALAVFTVIIGFSELGLSACLARRDADPDTIGPTVTFLSLVSGATLAAILYFGAGSIAPLLGSSAAKEPLQVLSISILLTGIFAAPVGMINRRFRQDVMFKSSLYSAFPSLALQLFLAMRGDGALAFAWARVLGEVVMGGYIMWKAGPYFLPKIQPAHIRTVLAFGLPVAGANLVRYLLVNTDYLFIGKLIGDGPLGLYTLAFQIGSWATAVLTSVINSVAMPAFSHTTHSTRRLRRATMHAISMVALIAFPISVFTAIFSGPIVRVVYGSRWSGAAELLSILSIYGALFALTLLYDSVLVGLGHSKQVLWLQLIWLVILFPAMWLGVWIDGVAGAAWAHVFVVLLLMIPAHLLAVRRYVPDVTAMTLWHSTRPAVISLISVGIGWLFASTFDSQIVQLLAGGAVSVVLYIALSARPLMRLVKLASQGR